MDRLDLLDFDATSDLERSTLESSNANEGNVGDSPYMVFVSTDGLTAGMFRMDDAGIQFRGVVTCASDNNSTDRYLFCAFIKLYQ